MCLYSAVMKNPRYGYSKKNGGKIPVLKDKRVGFIAGGCGRCMECLKQKGLGWRVRLMEDVKDYSEAKFVTLTFSEESLKDLRNVVNKDRKLDGYALDNEVAVLAVKRFRERWRKKTKKSPRHWLVTELGDKNGRIHMHGIVYGSKEMIEEKWMYGFVDVKEHVNDVSINYITKYITKIDVKHKEYRPKICTSAGIGAGYIEKSRGKHKYVKGKTRTDYRMRSGVKVSLPIYYKKKLWSDDEREELWIDLLDKDERWVGGEKILKKYDRDDVQETELRRYYQHRNEQLGYGKREKKWDEIGYRNDKQRLNKKKERSRVGVE